MDKPIWRELIAIGAAGLVAVIAFTFIDAPAPATSQDLAAWVQGVGTVVAVGVAVWLGFLPLHLEDLRKAARRREFAFAIGHATTIILERWEGTFVAARAKSLADLRAELDIITPVDPVEALTKLLEEPLIEWPSAIYYIDALTFRDAVLSFKRVATATVTSRAAARPRLFGALINEADFIEDMGMSLLESAGESLSSS